MTLHLSHALPWDALNEAFSVEHQLSNRHSKIPEERTSRIRLSTTTGKVNHNDADKGRAGWKVVQHFARSLATQIAEFRITDKWSDIDGYDVDEARVRFDYSMWDNFANWACLPEPMSIVCGYILINMMLLDEAKWRPLVNDCSYLRDSFELCHGFQDRGHPEWLGEPFRQAFQIPGSHKLLPIGANVATVLKNQAKQLFRVMYRSPAWEADEIAWLIANGMAIDKEVEKLTGTLRC